MININSIEPKVALDKIYDKKTTLELMNCVEKFTKFCINKNKLSNKLKRNPNKYYIEIVNDEARPDGRTIRVIEKTKKKKNIYRMIGRYGIGETGVGGVCFSDKPDKNGNRDFKVNIQSNYLKRITGKTMIEPVGEPGGVGL